MLGKDILEQILVLVTNLTSGMINVVKHFQYFPLNLQYEYYTLTQLVNQREYYTGSSKDICDWPRMKRC